MPIYAYKCASCGHAKDVLQKLSDAPLSACPACGAETFTKQITAAGFQLKGSGWYATDFRNGSNKAPAKPDDKSAEPAKTEAANDSKVESKTETKTEAKPAVGTTKTDAPSAAGG